MLKSHAVLALTVNTVFLFQHFTFKAKNKTNKKFKFKVLNLGPLLTNEEGFSSINTALYNACSILSFSLVWVNISTALDMSPHQTFPHTI